MRNLVLIHLESLSMINYRMNQDIFPNLSHWEKKSLFFSRYFSTATSTLMVVGDLLYGGMLQYEVCDSMDCIPGKYCYEESLFDELGDKGYETKVLYYPGGVDCESAKRRHITGFRNVLGTFQEYEDYILEAKRVMDTGKPFALLLCNVVSNVALNYRVPGGKLKSGLDRWKEGYRFMDVCAGEITRLLESKDLIENTTLIFYGDHGDDYYTHGMHGGLTHAIEPYGGLIHTPLWIYDGRMTVGECNDLISTVDIGNIVKRLLQMPEKRFDWSELGLPVRKYAAARNVYAAQPVRSDSFNKGYSLTDGRFLLMVSNRGLEMFDIEMDMQCQNNLLRFFVLEQGVLHMKKELNASLQHHYRYLFDMAAVRQIRRLFYFLRKKLYCEVMELFRYAGCEDKIDELGFEQIYDN